MRTPVTVRAVPEKVHEYHEADEGDVEPLLVHKNPRNQSCAQETSYKQRGRSQSHHTPIPRLDWNALYPAFPIAFLICSGVTFLGS